MQTNSGYTVHWLAPVEFPLANKFYRKHRFRGKAKRHEYCAIVKDQNGAIVACGYLRDYQSFMLLAGVAVAADHQQKGVGRLLVSHLAQMFDNTTYTFPYEHLARWYQSFGFVFLDAEKQDNKVQVLYQRYLNQGREIVTMRFAGK